MADPMKTNIKGLFDNAESVKDGKMPKDELAKVCTHLGMTTEEVTTMFTEIAPDASEIATDAFLDWVFGAGTPSTTDASPPKKEEEEEEEEEDDVEDEMDEPPPMKTTGARSSVSAEAYGNWNVKKAFDCPVYPKTDEQNKRIKDTLSSNFLFQSVDPADFEKLLGAVQEITVAVGTRIIQQGAGGATSEETEDGDNGAFMCIIEKGSFDCLVKKDDTETCVKTCTPGDVFGELALMYSCPRKASVVATTEGTCWKLDRDTFNNIVRDAAAKKREKYSEFLKKVPLLEKMDEYERSQVADALKEETLEEGKVVVTEGEEGDKFYIVAEGTATATKTGMDDLTYKAGDYFGELALMKDQPRAATVTSKGCKALSLDRKSFKRLLGGVDQLGTKAKQYATPVAETPK
jgi:cAMP-dependent protein kinase regulator